MYRVLKAMGGPLQGEEYLIGERVRIGRSGDLAIQLIGPTVSRHHAELRVEADGATVLCDLGSRNGTLMDGERIDRVQLRDGDTFEVGSSTFVFEEREGPAPNLDQLQLNLLSGPVEDETALFRRDDVGLPASRRPTTLPSAAMEGACIDPLHEMARSKGWRYCPACGQTSRGTEPSQGEASGEEDTILDG